LALMIMAAPAGSPSDPADLIRAVIENESPPDETIEMVMRLIEAKGGETRRTAISHQKRKVSSRPELMRVIRFHSPAEMKRAAVLILENEGADNDQWAFLPAMFTTRRIPSANRGDRYMGTDFCYQDISTIPIEKHSFRYLGEETIDGAKCRIVERIPTDERLKKESSYAKAVQWIDPHAVVVKEEFHDASGKVIRRFTAGKVSKVEGKYFRPASVEMLDLVSRHRTVIEFTGRKIGSGLKDGLFTVRALERER